MAGWAKMAKSICAMDRSSTIELMLDHVSWLPSRGLRVWLPAGWAAAPFEVGSTLMEDECLRFVEICRRHGATRIVCATFEREGAPEVLEDDLEPSALDSLQRRLAGQYQILADDQLTLIVIFFSTVDSGIVFGAREECSEFLGVGLDSAIQDFRGTVGVWGERLAQRLAQAPWNDLASGGPARTVEIAL